MITSIFFFTYNKYITMLEGIHLLTVYVESTCKKVSKDNIIKKTHVKCGIRPLTLFKRGNKRFVI